jgi:hypothetical protein
MRPSGNGFKRLLLLLFVVLFGLSASSRSLLAQGTNGTLTGQVVDPSGAAIPEANVTLTDVGTSFPQTVTTDGTGTYVFKLVPPGNYMLTVVARGFAKYVQQGIVTDANTNATQNVQMKLGSSSQTVSVTANAELIDTTTAELGLTINENSVSQLPLNGRDPSALALLSPGVVDAGKAGVSWMQSGFSFPGESAASANGGRIGSTYYMLDGVSNMDNYLGTNSPTPNPDATQEFRLISNNFSAVYGFSTGGVVSMATRSGTNTWHGGLFRIHAQRRPGRRELEQPPTGYFQAQPVRRLCRRTGHQESPLLLFQLPGNHRRRWTRNFEQLDHNTDPADAGW